jgi:hypothetical protein
MLNIRRPPRTAEAPPWTCLTLCLSLHIAAVPPVPRALARRGTATAGAGNGTRTRASAARTPGFAPRCRANDHEDQEPHAQFASPPIADHVGRGPARACVITPRRTHETPRCRAGAERPACVQPLLAARPLRGVHSRHRRRQAARAQRRAVPRYSGCSRRNALITGSLKPSQP